MGFLVFILALLTIVSVALLISAGSSPHFLPTFYFLKISTANLNIPSALSNSTLLQGLSTLTGTDYVGHTQTASTLGLAEYYRVAILATCADYKDGTTKCTRMQIGHSFNFESGLNLDHNIGLEQTIDQYRVISVFSAIGYLLAKIFIFFCTVVSLWFGRRRWGAILGAIFSALATILLIGCASTELPTFIKLNSDLNAAYSQIGLHVELGHNLFILGWIATTLCFLKTVVLIFGIKKSGNAQYARVDRQGGAVLFDQKDARHREMSMDGDRERLVHANARESVDGGHSDLGYAHPSTVRPKSLHRLPAGEKESSYEPYRAKS